MKQIKYNQKTIRSKLTLSHFAVTVISFFVLEILLISAYYFYSETELSAEGAGLWAAKLADAMSIQYEDDATLKDIAQSYVNIFYTVYLGKAGEQIKYPANSEWLLVISPSGKIISSNIDDLFSADYDLRSMELPGFSLNLKPEKRNDEEFLFNHIAYSYSRDGEAVFGQATIVNEGGDLAGWVYYGTTIKERFLFFTKNMFINFFFVQATASVVAILISWWLCGLIARSYSNRLTRLRDAMVSMTTDDFSVTIHVKDGDEIDQLGKQFNIMASQLQERIRELKELSDKNALLAEEASALTSLEERNRIARELHDSIKQQLFAFRLSAGVAAKLIDKDTVKAKMIIVESDELAKNIQLELDEIILQLRPSSLKNKDLPEALKEYCQKWEKGTGIFTEVSIIGQKKASSEVENALYRIAQETLNNIKKHSCASQVKVLLEYETDLVRLCIEDNGSGFDATAVDNLVSTGLKGMRERVEEFYGSFKIQNNKDTGTVVCAEIPS